MRECNCKNWSKAIKSHRTKFMDVSNKLLYFWWKGCYYLLKMRIAELRKGLAGCSEKKIPCASGVSDVRCPASSKRLHFWTRCSESHFAPRSPIKCMMKDCKPTCIYKRTAVTSGLAVWGVGLRSFAFWDCGFECCGVGHVCLLWVLCVVR